MKLHIGGDFARAGRSHNLWGGVVSLRQHLLYFCYLDQNIETQFKIEISPVASLPVIAMVPTLM